MATALRTWSAGAQDSGFAAVLVIERDLLSCGATAVEAALVARARTDGAITVGTVGGERRGTAGKTRFLVACECHPDRS